MCKCAVSVYLMAVCTWTQRLYQQRGGDVRADWTTCGARADAVRRGCTLKSFYSFCDGSRDGCVFMGAQFNPTSSRQTAGCGSSRPGCLMAPSLEVKINSSLLFLIELIYTRSPVLPPRCPCACPPSRLAPRQLTQC